MNSCVPSEPRCIFPDDCFPSPTATDVDAEVPTPNVILPTSLNVGGKSLNVSFNVIAGTGITATRGTADEKMKAQYDRARLGLSLSYHSLDRVIVLIMNDEPEEVAQEFTTFMIAKQIQTVTTFFICFDDPTFRIAKSIQKTCMAAYANYGKDWQFRSVSSKPTPDEVSQLFTDILSYKPTPAAAAPGGAKSTGGGGGGGGGGRRGTCSLF